ncbi:SRPBCC family protein [Mycolicibacterium hodleri]|uniref:Polyketide cyclase n=1 Tax=Mycolicibacterium hodleri TaxID=49897 RepID=A0A502DN01_9MYCO|nr:SRPBCC family protein [Mycolicibacterium hodleri]TPG25571.1 hypothetical protein EAH80_30100 [Mycolicibacterium hodleri]
MPHVRYAAVLEAPADKVWDMVRDFGSLPRWFPFVVSSDLSGGPYEVGAVRTNHIQDGTTIVERLTEISEHERRVVYDVIGGDATMSNYTACLSVAEVSDTDRTFVQWTATFDPLNGDGSAEAEWVRTGIFHTCLAELGRVLGTNPETTPPDADTSCAHADTVRDAFQAWGAGTGSPYDLMDVDTEIVLAGSSAHCGTYRKDTFLREVAEPFTARFATPPVPRLRRLWTADDTVAVWADAAGTTLDHQPYANSYVFVFELSARGITRVTEFLDMAAFEEVWDCVAPAPS